MQVKVNPFERGTTPTISVTTTKQTGFTFTLNSGGGRVEWGDGNQENFSSGSKSPTHNYGSPGTYVVNIYCVGDDVVSFECQTQSLSAADFSKCYSITDFKAAANSLGTALTLPPRSGNMTAFRVENSGLSGSFDFSNLTLGGVITMNTNASLTGVTFGSSSQTITSFTAYSSGLTSLNISPLTGMGGSFRIESCSSLTSFTGVSTTNTFSNIFMNSCAFTTLDVSGFQAGGTTMRFYSNAGLTSLTLPSAATVTTGELRIDNCDLGYVDTTGITFGTTGAQLFNCGGNTFTATEEDHTLVDLDANMGSGTGTLSLAGDNAAPTDGTVTGFDGLTAKANLVTKGYTVTTN